MAYHSRALVTFEVRVYKAVCGRVCAWVLYYICSKECNCDRHHHHHPLSYYVHVCRRWRRRRRRRRRRIFPCDVQCVNLVCLLLFSVNNLDLMLAVCGGMPSCST